MAWADGTEEISNSADLIDSREVIARIEYLKEIPDTFAREYEGEETEELEKLTALASEASGYAADWEYGETLIRDSYFKEYAQDLAEDCGMIPANLSWPASCIDWDQAARELQMDYTSVDFDGVTYWIR